MNTWRTLGLAGTVGGLSLLLAACGPDEPAPMEFEPQEDAPAPEAAPDAPADPEPMEFEPREEVPELEADPGEPGAWEPAEPDVPADPAVQEPVEPAPGEGVEEEWEPTGEW